VALRLVLLAFAFQVTVIIDYTPVPLDSLYQLPDIRFISRSRI